MIEVKKSTITPELLAQLREKVKSNPQMVAEAIDHLKAPDMAELLNPLSLDSVALIMQIMPYPEAIAVFNEPSFERRAVIMQSLDTERAAKILKEISSDERVDLIQRMDGQYRQKLIPLLPEHIQAETRLLLQFPPTTAGGNMSTEFVKLNPDMLVQGAIDLIRTVGKSRLHIYSAYVLDDDDRLLGAVSLRDLVVSEPNKTIGEIMRKYPISVNCLEDQEQVVRKLAKYNLLALPVVDDHNRVLGFVTVDDALDVMVEEQTEDVQKLGAVEALDEPYMSTPRVRMIRKRAGWLVILFLSEMLTATAMGFFEKEIEKAVVLALFVPLIISSGGNSGSQASTLIIRAIALGEAKLTDWWKVMRNEVFSGLILGGILGSIGFLRIAIWSMFTDIYGPHWLFVAITIFVSLIGVVLWGTLSGSMLPFVLKRLGFDPAASSAPFVATLVDVTGLVIYFSVAAVVLHGRLL